MTRLREFFGYVRRGELWDGAPAYWHRGRAYRRLANGTHILGLTRQADRAIRRPWVAAERIGLGRYVRHPDSPEFTNITKLIDWLEERGLVERGGPDGEIKGWGDPWYAVDADFAERPIPAAPAAPVCPDPPEKGPDA